MQDDLRRRSGIGPSARQRKGRTKPTERDRDRRISELEETVASLRRNIAGLRRKTGKIIAELQEIARLARESGCSA